MGSLPTQFVIISCLCLSFPILLNGKCCDDNTCVFQDSDNPENTLDLSAFSCSTLDHQQGAYHFLFTPCGDRDSCTSNSETITGMMVQSDPDEGFCARIAGWDDFETQPTYNDDKKEWLLYYENGDSCFGAPRTFTTVWRCRSSENRVHIETVEEPVACNYVMILYTKYACPGHQYSKSVCLTQNNSSLSGGWIFIIIFISIIFIYCIVGYIIMATTINKENGFNDIKGNIPNFQFWKIIPKYVMAGCFVTYQYVMNLIRKEQGNNNSDHQAVTAHHDEI